MAETVFIASGDSCAMCTALDGTNCASLPHPGCMCQLIPVDDDPDCEIDYTFTKTHRGSKEFDVRLGGEITVTCPDGTTIGESFEADLNDYADTAADEFEAVQQAFHDHGEELCEQCPPPEPFKCC